MATVDLIKGRTCGSCSLCCKLLRIDAFEKPNGQWCSHCEPGRGGCKIYDTRPDECREFYCGWLTAEDVGPEWYPQKSKMVLYSEGDGNRIAIHVDPIHPTAWRQEPYYGQLKKMAIAAAETHQQLVIYIKHKVIVLVPGKEIELGEMQRGDHIITAAKRTPSGVEWHAHIVPAKDVPPEKVGNGP